MPYNSETSQYERRATTVIDATPDGDTVAVAIDVKLDQGIDDYVTDLNHHAANGRHYPATSVADDSRFLKQSPAGVVSWADGAVAADAALKDFSNVASGAIAPAKIAQDASNRFVTDAEKSTWNGALYDKADVEGVLTGTITSHTHAAASEGAQGLIELATSAEVAALTDTIRAITPSGLGAVFARSFGASGYLKLPGGLILQWGAGITQAYSTKTFSFPIAFAAGCYALIAQRGMNGSNAQLNAQAISSSQFSVQDYALQNECFSWMAVGI